MKASDNIEFAYFKEPITIRTANSSHPYHVVSYERFDIKVVKNWLVVIIDGFTTLIPLNNVKSIVLLQE